MKVAVLGGGPSGAFAAEKLAAAGVETIVVDEKLAWEKPCGGGLTYKAWSEYPFLANNATPHKTITESVLSAPKSKPVTLTLDRPLLIYSRLDLNGMLLARAQKAGAQIEQTRVLSAERIGTRWALRTKNGTLEADHCVIATGARNSMKAFGTELKAADAMIALGYYVPGDREKIDIQFLPGLDGYIWVFPRRGHLSVGICGKGEPAAALRTRLETWMAEQGLSREGAAFYSHLLPSLETASWKSNRISGEGWHAVGDAAGLVDPITGEGLYYAIRSADLAAQSILTGVPYRQLLKHGVTDELEFASSLAHRVFHGSFAFGTVTSRMVQFTRRSPQFRALMQDLFAGTQPYAGLKRRLLKNLNRSMLEIALSLFAGEDCSPQPKRSTAP